jgi:glutamyl/glutaminyl-tRNA synthetase
MIMPSAPRTRLAPTPSGFLHPGNAWSFLITWLIARSQGGTIQLRIDDLDTARFREEYSEDIFASLAWLGLDWDTGPRDLADFKALHSQHRRIGKYRAALDRLAGKPAPDGPLVYACACSREKVRRDSLAAGRPGVYPGTCRNAGIPFGRTGSGAESFPLRVRVPDNAEVTLEDLKHGPEILRPGADMGDFVVWQRNGDPAYQLASLVDDEEYGTDLVVRGKDLLPSTGAQAWLAGLLGYPGFPAARFVHHGLILGADGGKLSKSQGADSLRALRERLGDPSPLLGFFARRLGMDPQGTVRPVDLLKAFKPMMIPERAIPWSEFAGESGG